MKAASLLTAEEARRLRGVLFDLDDTVLTHGRLTRGAYDAMCRLSDAGLTLVAVTGRPSGWGEVLARQWPIAGCVTENGAVHVVRDGAGIARREGCDDAERRSRRARLGLLTEQVRRIVPEARLTDDSEMRRSDVAWDIGERARLPADRIREIVGEIERAGGRWSQSSVHLHATFDVDDKASGTLRFCALELGEDSGAALARFAFVGDSGNDGPCFAAFRTTFGVANVLRSARTMSVPPRYVARAPMGDGFSEIATLILDRRAPLA
ncbi:MAG TPA: hypothetical protein VEK07_13235 [Polyangiaceae bacterium]|nr:hypothetical protein [Polyangiaceae bacterium]